MSYCVSASRNSSFSKCHSAHKARQPVFWMLPLSNTSARREGGRDRATICAVSGLSTVAILSGRWECLTFRLSLAVIQLFTTSSVVSCARPTAFQCHFQFIYQHRLLLSCLVLSFVGLMAPTNAAENAFTRLFSTPNLFGRLI